MQEDATARKWSSESLGKIAKAGLGECVPFFSAVRRIAFSMMGSPTWPLPRALRMFAEIGVVGVLEDEAPALLEFLDDGVVGAGTEETSSGMERGALGKPRPIDTSARRSGAEAMGGALFALSF